MKRFLEPVRNVLVLMWQALKAFSAGSASLAKIVVVGMWQMALTIARGLRALWLNALGLIAIALVFVAASVPLFLVRASDGDVERIARWLDIAKPYAPYATATVALLAGGVALLGIAQRHNADRRAEWWRRTQYAVDLVREDDVGRDAGLELIEHLRDTRSWHKKDVWILQSVTAVLVDELIAKRVGPVGEDEEPNLESP